MNTQTIERRNIHSRIDDLPDSALPMVDELLDFVRFKVQRYDDHTPNAKTAAAIRDARAGNVQRANSIKEFFDAMNTEYTLGVPACR